MKHLHLFSLLTTGVALMGVPAFAAGNGQEDNSYDQMTSKGPKEMTSSTKMESPFRAEHPCFDDGMNVVFYGEYLYWKAEEDELGYAVQSPNYTTHTPGGLSQIDKGVDGSIEYVDSSFSSAYRVGFTWLVFRDEWDATAEWTSFHHEAHGSVGQKTGQVVFPYRLNDNYGPIAMSARAGWHITMNFLDAVLGRSLFVGERLALRPYAGFRGAWIRQVLTADYFNITFGGNPTGGTTPELDYRQTSHFSGYGIVAGMDAKWKLGYGFSLLSNLTTALLSGDFHLDLYEENANGTPRTKVKDDVKVITPIFRVFGGIEWQKMFEKQRCYIELHAGCEEQMWFDQNQFDRFTMNPDNITTWNHAANLSLFGLTAGIKFGF